MWTVGLTLLIVNAVFLAGLGWPLARYLSRNLPGARGARAWLAALGGAYLAECVAFSAGMATNVLSVCLAALWGLLLASRVRAMPPRQATWLALRFSLYTCLPAVSFLSILPLLPLGGWSLWDPRDARQFGVPDFVPWPLCTLLGFFLAVSLSAVVLKTTVTTGLVALLVRRSRRRGPMPSPTTPA